MSLGYRVMPAAGSCAHPGGLLIRNYPTLPRLLAIACGGIAGFATAAGYGSAVLIMSVLLLTIFMCAVAASSLWLKLYAYRTPESFDAISFSEPTTPEHGFSLILPARHEERVLANTIDTLMGQTHPRFELLVVVSGDDDEATRRVALDKAAEHDDRLRVVEVFGKKNKPRALNAALPLCHYDIVGVKDAESIVSPDLLRYVDTRFTETGVAVVQSGVQLMNFHSSWWSL
jgi:cellulose synthase/poly-beta-1,6-N-acetylglucosamine synthase-like glycosyltransferase